MCIFQRFEAFDRFSEEKSLLLKPKNSKIQSKKQDKGHGMLLNLYLDDDQSDQLMLMLDLLNDPDVTIESYANELFSDLLSRIWCDLTKENIVN